MKKRFSDKASIELDLTSLLDVILIILIVVMCHTSLDSLNDQSTEDENPGEEAHEEDIDEVGNQISVVTLYVSYGSEENPDDYKTRNFELRYDYDDEVAYSMTITPEDDDQAKLDELVSELDDFVAEKYEEDIPVLLTLHDQDMLYRDEQVVENEINVLNEKYSNLYYQGMLAQE